MSEFSDVIPGSMYQHGQGVEENIEEAVKHFQSGAELGEELCEMVTIAYPVTPHAHICRGSNGSPLSCQLLYSWEGSEAVL